MHKTPSNMFALIIQHVICCHCCFLYFMLSSGEMSRTKYDMSRSYKFLDTLHFLKIKCFCSNVISLSSHYSNIPDHSEHQDGNVKWMVISLFSSPGLPEDHLIIPPFLFNLYMFQAFSSQHHGFLCLTQKLEERYLLKHSNVGLLLILLLNP